MRCQPKSRHSAGWGSSLCSFVIPDISQRRLRTLTTPPQTLQNPCLCSFLRRSGFTKFERFWVFLVFIIEFFRGRSRGGDNFTFQVLLTWDPARHLQSPKPRNPESLKKVSREEFGTPGHKAQKKVRKVQNIVDFDYFLDSLDFFQLFFGGPGSGGPKLLSGDSFETFRGFGLCRWPAGSQLQTPLSKREKHPFLP